MWEIFVEWLNYTDATAFGMQMGALAGVFFTVGIAGIALVKKYRWLLAAVLLALVTPLATGGFWFSTGQLGISDWDYYFSMHTNIRNSVMEYGIFPFWNPWTCGGTSALGDPEFPLLSPLFLLELAFGTPAGLVLSIFVSTTTLAIGMLLLAKRLRASVYGGLTAASIVAFGSVNLLEIVEGHPNVFSVMWVPWIFWALAAAYTALPFRGSDLKRAISGLFRVSDPKFHAFRLWTVATGVFLALTFFQGGIYMLMYVALSLGVLLALLPDRIQAAIAMAVSGIWALGFAAIKLIPVFYWLSQFQDKAYASSAFTILSLHNILLGRIFHGAEDVILDQGGGWHEYGAYVGIAAVALAIVGAVSGYKKKTVRIVLLGGLAALLLSSAGPVLKPLFDQAPFLPRSNISRVILFTVIAVGLLAARGIDTVRSSRWGTWPAIAFVGILAIELMSFSYALSEQAFVLPRNAQPVPPAPSPVAYTTFDYKIRHKGVDYTRAYEATLAGYGNLSYCSVLSPDPAVRTIHAEEDNDIATVKTKQGKYVPWELVSWNPNGATLNVKAHAPSSVVLNTNYARGWRVNGKPAKEIGNRVGTQIQAGDQELAFTYVSPGFRTGLAITGIAVAAAAAWLWVPRAQTKSKKGS